MLREIRSVAQRSLERRKRWFQDDYFDLYVWESPAAEVLEIQLCYARGGRDERALVWKRGAGYAHMNVESGAPPLAALSAPLLRQGGRFGGWRVRERLYGALDALEPGLAAFIRDVVGEYCDPPRRYPRRGRSAPDWLRRLRARARL